MNPFSKALCVPKVLGMASLAAALLAGCGGTQSMPQQVVAMTQGGGALPASLVLRVPSSVSSSAARRTRYVAATSKSAKLTIAGSAGCTQCSPAATIEVALSAGGICVAGAGGMTCTIPLSLLPGMYGTGLTVYDGALDAQGHVTGKALSEKTAFPMHVASASTNTTAVVLDGVPASIVQTILTPSSVYTTTGVQNQVPYTIDRIAGTGAQVALNAKDADGNIIAGPGAPAWTVNATGAGYGATLSGNTVAISGPSGPTKARGTLGIAANSPACSDAAALCTLVVQLGMAQTVAIADGSVGTHGTTFVWNLAAQAASTALTAGINGPVAVAFAPDGTLFVANFLVNSVFAYAPPYTGSPVVITSGISLPRTLITDAAGNLYVGNLGAPTTMVFPPPYTTATPGKIAAAAYAMAFDQQGDLWMVTGPSAQVRRYAPPFAGTTPLTTLTVPNPSAGLTTAVAVTPGGTVYACDNANNVVQRYDPPYTAAPTSIPVASPASVGVAPDGTVLIGGNSGLAVYNGSGQLLRTITAQVNNAQAIAFDDDGTAWVATYQPNGAVGVPYPYDGTALRALNATAGVFKQPSTLAVYP